MCDILKATTIPVQKEGHQIATVEAQAEAAILKEIVDLVSRSKLSLLQFFFGFLLVI